MGKILEERTGRRVEAINTGLSGLRADHHAATLRKIERYAPDLVVVMMGVNDWNRHIRTGGDPYFGSFYDLLEYIDLRKSLIAEAYRGAAVRLRAGGKNGGSAEPQRDDGTYLSKQNDSLTRPLQREFRPQTVSANYRRNAHEIMELCKRQKLACLIVDQPTAYDAAIEPELRKRLWMTPPNEDYTLTLDNMAYIAGLYNSWLRDTAANVGLPFCSVSPHLRPTTAVFYDDCHFNEPGAHAVARLISDCIVQHELVKY
jgi:lysophospholipase L1-like esterase